MIFPNVYSAIREALGVLIHGADVCKITCALRISIYGALSGQIPKKLRTIRGLQSVPLRAVRRIDVRRGRIRHRVRVERLDCVQDGGIGQGEQGSKVGSEFGGGVVVSRNPDASLVCIKALGSLSVLILLQRRSGHTVRTGTLLNRPSRHDCVGDCLMYW
jgi:hypothetical protein